MYKHCVKCGKEIIQEAEFCKYCGAAQSAKAASSQSSRKKDEEIRFNNSGRSRKTEKMPVIRLAIAALVVIGVIAACVTGAFWLRHRLGDSSSNKSAQSIEQSQGEKTVVDKTGEADEPQNTDKDETNMDANKESDNAKTEEQRDDSDYKVGEIYTVVAEPNLLVRKGAGKDQEILTRGELIGDDYAQSVGTTDTQKAALAKGSKIVCLEMAGKWMRIESGWICTEDSGEILVK